MDIDAPAVAARIEQFIRRQLDAFGRDGAVIGVSGTQLPSGGDRRGFERHEAVCVGGDGITQPA